VLLPICKRGAAQNVEGDRNNMPDIVSATATVTALYRYPIKGLTPEPMTTVELAAGGTMPFDRAFAIENGPGPFDPKAPKHLPKMHFVMLMRNEQLATLNAKFDDANQTLTLTSPSGEEVRGDLRTASGRATLEGFVARIMGPALRGAPRIVVSPPHSFSDVEPKCLHIVNLASVRALEAAMGVAINPLRFRPNVIIDGLPAWQEFDWVGQHVQAGQVKLDVFTRTERCAATNVDPATGARDLKIPSFLSRTYGHTDFGIYAKVAAGGVLRPGDAIALSV
jgi:uncharacterized protein